MFYLVPVLPYNILLVGGRRKKNMAYFQIKIVNHLILLELYAVYFLESQ